MKSVNVITLGCSKNKVDTEHLLAALPSDVYSVIEEESKENPDILLLNTCGFIGDAKEESIQAVLEAVEAKNRGEVSQVIVFGCLSQRYEKELRAEIPEVDYWFGARDLASVARCLGSKAENIGVQRYSTDRKPYAFLKISEGCDRRCSYCAIPFIRGAHKSVPIEQIVAEARLLAARGVKELVLIAQDTTFYGLDLYGKRRLADVLKALSDIDGIEWIRIHYSYPADFPEDVLEQMSVNPKVCKYLDIPLQHISDPVLSNMHRHVDSAWTRELISKLRNQVPGVVLRTTMIVGFPGEGDAQFEELLAFVRAARFERLGAFKYSEEEGTWGAGHLDDSIADDIKQSRLDALMEQQAGISLEFNRSRVGSVVRVLADDYIDGALVCRSQYESPEVDGEIIVRCLPSKASLVGSFFNVRITGADLYDLQAELIEE